MRNDGRDEFDEILDSALASYCARQPLPGIEQRVIARLPRAKQRDAWVRWMVPAPVLAAVLVIMAYWIKPEARHVDCRRASYRQGAIAAATRSSRREKDTRLHRAHAAQPSVVKAAVFPAPSPPTAEERALMQLAVLDPEILQNAQISQHRRSQPLMVERINIPPLQSSDSMED